MSCSSPPPTTHSSNCSSNAEEVQCILTMASCLFELCKDNPTCGLLHQPIVALHNIILVAEGEESTDSILSSSSSMFCFGWCAADHAHPWRLQSLQHSLLQGIDSPPYLQQNGNISGCCWVHYFVWFQSQLLLSYSFPIVSKINIFYCNQRERERDSPENHQRLYELQKMEENHKGFAWGV